MRLEGLSCGLVQSIQLEESEVTGANGRIQIIRTGKFFHPWYGEFEITLETLQEMKRNFDRNTLKNDLMIDFNHECEEAGAWIKSLDIRQFESGEIALYADIEFTPKGRKAVEDKEYKYISADFTERFIDNETQTEFGALLFGAAFTNRPFIKGMDPALALSELTKKNKETFQMNLEQIKQENEKLLSDVTTLNKKLEDLADAQKKLSEENTKLKEEKQKFEEEKALKEKEDAFSKLLSEGKAVPAQKEAYMKGDMVQFAELFMPVQKEPKGVDGGDALEADPEDKILSIANKIADERKLSLDAAMREAIRENPELYKLQQAKFN